MDYVVLFYWLCCTEVSQIIFYLKAYLKVDNLMDVWIITNWVIIAIVRFSCIGVSSGNADGWATCTGRNEVGVMIHMFVFCLQVVILWGRIALIFRTSQTGMFLTIDF